LLRLLVLYFILFLGWKVHLKATTTKVGNGDIGADLKYYSQITEGPILISKLKALEHLKQLNIANIPGLSQLTPELRHSKIYLTKSNLDQKQLEKLGAYEDSLHIYARTFPKAHASTRFFPKSLELNEKELIALHIHEALHRSLPLHMRENEQVVSKLVTEITSPEANFDQINSTMQKLMAQTPNPLNSNSSGGKSYSNVSFKKYDEHVVTSSKLNNPSSFNFEYRVLDRNKKKTFAQKNQFKTLTYINTELFPFGEDLEAFGLGLGLSFIQGKDKSYMGPLNVSARALLFTSQGYDFEAFGQASINTLSSEEFTNSYIGRDVFALGFNMNKNMKNFFIHNSLSYTLKSSSEEKLGNIKVEYEFGDIISWKIKAGTEFNKFRLALFSELFLMNNTIIKQSNYQQETQRLRFFSVGPEVSYQMNNFNISLFGRFKVNSTNNVNFDEMGNILGVGVGNGHIGTGISYAF
jgi:hypothetical protein